MPIPTIHNEVIYGKATSFSNRHHTDRGILKKYSLAAQAAAVVYAVSAYQFRKAASGNRGIVITMSPNVDTGLYTYWVISQ